MKKSFDNYIELYIQCNRERRFSKDEKKTITATKRNKDTFKEMITFYPEETKTVLLELMDHKDVWLALGAAKDYAYNFELTFKAKKKILQTIKRCETCKTCTGVEKVSLMILANYVNIKTR